MALSDTGGRSSAANYPVTALLVSFIGAVVLLAVVNLARRGRVR